jgi:ribose transport system substrate-binding protein
MGMSIGHLRRMAVPLAVAAAAAALAACGSDSGGSSAKGDGGGAKAAGASCPQAQQAVDKATKPLQLTLPSEAVPMSKIAGKSVWYIAPDMSLPFIAAIAHGFKDAAQAAGLKPTIFDGKGNVNTFNQGVSAAVSQGADGILLQGINPALVSGPLQQATKQKIAIVDSLNGGPDQPLTGGVQAHVTVDYRLGGALMADYAATSTGCKGQAIFFTSSIYNIYKDMVAGFKDELAHVCPDCQLADVVNVAPTDLATKLGGLTSTAAARHPDAKAFVAAYDGQVQFMEQALQERGGAGLAIISHDGVTSNLKQIQSGAGLQTMDVSNPPNEAMGWAEVDQLGRLLTKMQPVQDALPQQVFVKDNIKGDPEDVAALFPGYADYQSKWKQLWGVG